MPSCLGEGMSISKTPSKSWSEPHCWEIWERAGALQEDIVLLKPIPMEGCQASQPFPRTGYGSNCRCVNSMALLNW